MKNTLQIFNIYSFFLPPFVGYLPFIIAQVKAFLFCLLSAERRKNEGIFKLLRQVLIFIYLLYFAC